MKKPHGQLQHTDSQQRKHRCVRDVQNKNKLISLAKQNSVRVCNITEALVKECTSPAASHARDSDRNHAVATLLVNLVRDVLLIHMQHAEHDF